ncbi:MAG: ABC transporter permease, partial [Micavibrio sp.]
RVIRPNSVKNYWSSLWHYREVLYILSYRDIAVRYKQTILGYVWAILKPLLTMLVLTIVFGKIANLPSGGGLPYPILVLSGLIPWYFFSATLLEMSNSVINNKAMVSKIYFPRMFLPFSNISVGLIDLCLSMVILFIFMIVFGVKFSVTLLAIPAFIVLAISACAGIGLFFAALNVQYRDVQFIIPFIVQFGLYISPVGFSADLIPEKWRLLYSLNPMVGVIDGFRWAVSGGNTDIYWPGLIFSFAIGAASVFLGALYFRSVERKFADVI